MVKVFRQTNFIGSVFRARCAITAIKLSYTGSSGYELSRYCDVDRTIRKGREELDKLSSQRDGPSFLH